MRTRNEDKRNAVRTLLEEEEWSKWSDREIARKCVVDGKTVARLRSELVTAENRSDAEPRTYTTRHGTVAQMDTSRIGARLVSVKPERGARAFGVSVSAPPR